MTHVRVWLCGTIRRIRKILKYLIFNQNIIIALYSTKVGLVGVDRARVFVVCPAAACVLYSVAVLAAGRGVACANKRKPPT